MQCSAQNAADSSRDERLPFSKCLSAQNSASKPVSMKTGSENAHVDISTTGRAKRTQAHAHKTSHRDLTRRRSQTPATSIESPKAAALRGPATSCGSTKPNPKTANKTDVSGGHSPR